MEDKKKKRGPVILIIVLAAVLLIGVIVGLGFLLKKSIPGVAQILSENNENSTLEDNGNQDNIEEDAEISEDGTFDGVEGNNVINTGTLTENATVSSLKKYMTGPFISDRKRRDATEWCINSMRVKAPGPDEKIENLSGGNQQKIILGRWLLTKPRVLLLDEPTRGIDVGAKYEIYKLITELADEGCGIIFTSSELPELLGLADRIIVMSGGRIAGELDAACASQEKIMSYATMFL